MKRPLRRFGVPAAAFAAATIILAGCTAGPAPDSSGSDGDELAADQYELALDYVGGEAGAADPSLDAVKIGFINVEGGTSSFPEVTVGAQIAAEYVNTYLGGVDGHPLEIETCFIVEGDEDALKCAQQFVNDPSVIAIQLGMTIFGTGAIFQTVGDQKPIIGFGPFGPQDVGAENAIFYAASSYSAAPGAILQADALGLKSIAMAYELPGGAPQAQLQTAIAAGFGIELTAVPVANPSEWSTALVSAGALTADVIEIVGGPYSCVPAAQALQQIGATGKPVMTMDLCFTPALADELGDWPEWSFIGPQRTVYGNADDADIKEFVAAMEHFDPEASVGGATPTTFGIVLTQVKEMNAIGFDALTPDALKEALLAFTGPMYLGPDEIDCGQYASVGAPSLCAAYAIITTYEGDDQWSSEVINTEGLGLG